MGKLEFIRPGSAKDLYRVDKKSIAFRFNDSFSVFDVGRSKDKIPGKGAAICACAVKSFEIAKMIGIPTHFMEQIDETTIRVREMKIITDRPLTLKDSNYVVPAEWIDRIRAAGSIIRAFKEGTKKPEDYGLLKGKIPAEGTPFPHPIEHTTTKFENVDRDIIMAEVCRLGGITLKDYDEFWSIIHRLNGAIDLEMIRAGFIRLDGKKECGMGPDRRKMIVDVFGTQDEDRPSKIVDGKIIHYSKEYPRQIFIEMGYYEQVKRARKKGYHVPLIPRLSKDHLAEISRRYLLVAKEYAGVKIAV
ncbi:MAG: phosphoribosylaminoimidazolesuccinocarboxamide synthase [Parcubacteria group bacterium]